MCIDGKHIHKQKQLLPCNLNELFVQFKETYHNVKIMSSRSNLDLNCIHTITSSSGTHVIVCVRSYLM